MELENKITASAENSQILENSNANNRILKNKSDSTNNILISSYVKDWLMNMKFEDNNSDTSENTSADNESVDDLFDSFEPYNGLGLESEFSTNLNFSENTSLSDNVKIKSKKIVIQTSKNVHIGNITVFKRPVVYYNPINHTPNMESAENKTSSENENCNIAAAFIGNIRRHLGALHIVERICWLAQKPLVPYDYINKPVEFVIISHTATQSSTSRSTNALLVRNIQSFHVEPPLKWNDIGYNFLIGSDGLVYEGRGWNIVGAHAKGYNINSVGISFIGCFMKELPPEQSLYFCKELIKIGVKLGYIAENYKLVGHCQCSATESPGSYLFEELKTWDHYYGS